MEMTPGKHWITGGYVANDISATTVFYENGQFTSGPDMPVTVADHCMARLDEDTFILAGGNDYQGAGSAVYIFDVPTGTWTRWPDMSVTRANFGCGVAR